MEIEYKGGNGLVFATKNSKLVTDPNLSMVGLKDVSVKGAIQLATEPRFLVDAADATLTIEGPGEYEVGDFSIRGVAATRHIDTEAEPSGTTIYRIEVGEIRIALLGNIAANLDEDQLEAIGVVDILVIPVGGGGYTLDSVGAAKLVRQIDPKVVVPVHYAEAGVNYEVPQDSIDLFKTEMGLPVETVEKYKLKSSASLPAALTIIEIKRT
jgi:L-ascorbate metabolism protein UlaG (beta-lactamase superfamily)